VNQIKYRSGYKYQLAEDYRVALPSLPSPIPCGHCGDFLYLDSDRILTIYNGYAWDGPSGPTVDTPDSLRGSLVHDALYQLMREGHLGQDWRPIADTLLRAICLEDGMDHARADLWFAAVRAFAGSAADPAHNRPVLTAP
jgi:hypothetical protein